MPEDKTAGPINALIQKMDNMGDKIKDGIAVPLKAMSEELEASPKQMIAMATENNKAAMAAVNIAGRGFSFLKDKGKEKWEKIKAGKAKDESKEDSKWRKLSQKTSEKTSELIETGAIKTKEGLSVVSDTIKNMMSGSPPYLYTLSELTKVLINNSDIGTKIAKDQLNAQFESMMFSEERHEEDLAEAIESGIATKEFRKRQRLSALLTAGLGLRRRILDGKAAGKLNKTTFDYYQEIIDNLSAMKESLLNMDGIANSLDNIYDFTVENTPTSAERIEASRESADDGEKSPDDPKKKKKGNIFSTIAKAIAMIGVGIIGFAAGFVESVMSQLRAIKSFFKKFKLGEKIFKAFGTIGKLFKGDGVFGKAFAKIGNFFKSIKDFFMKFVTKTKSLSKVFTWMKNIGKVFGKFFLPITILMGAFEVVKGFMAGFKKDGIIGGIIGAVDGLIDFLVDTPINMIKDLISWLLKKFGFDDAAASMDAFEFDLSGMISKVWYGIANWIRGLFGMEPLGGSDDLETPEVEWSLWDTISNALSSVTTWLGELLSMDNLMFALKWFNPLGIISTAFMGIGNWLAGLFNLNLDALIDNILPDNMVGNAARGMLGIEKGAGKKLSADDLQGGTEELPADDGFGGRNIWGKEDTPEETEIPDYMTMTIEDLKKQQGEAYLERIAARSSYLKNAQSENDELKSKQTQSGAMGNIVQNQFNTSSSSTSKPVFSKSHAIESSSPDFTAEW